MPRLQVTRVCTRGPSVREVCHARQRRSVHCRAAADAQTAVITGGNTGIGYASAEALCRKGYRVILACRDDNKAAVARSKLIATVPSAQVDTLRLDLADLSSVRDAAQRLLDQEPQIDVLLNNAGVMATPALTTKDGFEFQLGVNHLGHFSLTTALLPKLTASSRPVRIVNVSSEAHRFGTIKFDDLMLTKDYQPWVSYGQSKLANVLFTYELARRLPAGSGITCNTLHPGVVQTELVRYLEKDIPKLLVPMLSFLNVFLKTPQQGAQTSVFLASSADVAAITSKYFDNCKQTASSAESYNASVAKRLWEVSEELVSKKSSTPVLTAAS